jgi:hypothetical protein
MCTTNRWLGHFRLSATSSFTTVAGITLLVCPDCHLCTERQTLQTFVIEDNPIPVPMYKLYFSCAATVIIIQSLLIFDIGRYRGIKFRRFLKYCTLYIHLYNLIDIVYLLDPV